MLRENMSNSDNAESAFRDLIEFCLGNPYTPWYWEGYIPFDHETHIYILDQETSKLKIDEQKTFSEEKESTPD